MAQPPVADKSAADSVIAERDIEFTRVNDRSLRLDLYRPRWTAVPTPVVVFVHGGGWKNGSRASAERTAKWLVEHGFAVAGIEYRLTSEAQWPAQIDDCYAAVRWLRTHATRYRLDPDHIGAWGSSAGGHLVALLGTRACPDSESVSSRVQAVCDWFGPTELLTMPPNVVGNGRTEQDVANSNGAKLLGATVRDVPAKARDASALDQVTKDSAPFLIMHGSQDPGVPVEQSTKLHAKLLSAGVPSRLHIVEGAGHGGKLFQSPESRQVVLRFFNETLRPHWHQGAGPTGQFQFDVQRVPTEWSVVRSQNIHWKKSLPETGQSTVVAWGDRLFFTTMKPVEADSELGSDIVAWCVRRRDGATLWQREIPARYPLRLSGCFSDSTGPPPVTDGQRVVFFNASGAIACFDFTGAELWRRELMAVGRSQPLLNPTPNGAEVVFIKQTYPPDETGNFTHEHKDAPLAQWTQLQALDVRTGEPTWHTTCGVNMGCVPLISTLSDGRRVAVVGRGGGHSPPEHPDGVSMVSAETGETIWTLPLEGFMSTQTFPVHDDQVLVFHGGEHLWVDALTGKIARRVNFVRDVAVRARVNGQWLSDTRSTSVGKQLRAIIQQSNLLVGDFHYFRSYNQPWLGRIHAGTGEIEFLQLPVQLSRTAGSDEDRLLWEAPRAAQATPEGATGKSQQRKPLPIQQWSFRVNDMRNSRGHVVMGDPRSKGNGWGHHATATPTAAGDFLFVPTMAGTVYVIRWNAARLDEQSLVAINDLGPAGGAWTRAGISYAGGSLFAHTLDHIFCINANEHVKREQP
ncbi:MAG: alpha/beta hydrolase fold domain-containing protein [Planctomycetales bacterium]|nr:alpha/beta hydrolase fold domain-containing protein [Planctomycetales bacterium]